MRFAWLSERYVALAIAASTCLALAAPAGSTALAQTRAPATAQDGDKAPEGADPRRKSQTSEAQPERKQGPPAKRRGRPPMMVGVDPVVRGPLQRTDPVIGRLVLRQGGVIAARIAGAVDEMHVQVGDRVETGDVLAVLDTDAAAAKLAYQKAELRIAQQELARLASLKSGNSMAFAKAKYEDAQQKLARAEANVRLAEIALRDAVIRAPYPGVVTKRNTEIGAYLNVGAAVVTMIDVGSLEIEADVPADRVAGLEAGVVVRFDLDGRTGIPARVRAVVPEQNALTRTLAVRLTPEFGEVGALRAVNQSVTIHVPVGAPRTVVSVHKDAVINQGESNLVYVAAEGLATPRPVRLGKAIGSRFEVLGGLEPGELVVVRGNERLRPGQPVRYRKRS